MSKKKTHEEYVDEVTKINPNIEVLDRYINAHTKILHKCKICGYEWLTKPNSVLSGYGCLKCAGTQQYTQEEYELKIKDVNLNIQVLGKYINMNTKILHKCTICGHEWEIKPNDVMNKHGCPVCAGKTIGNSPTYENSIWSSEYREYFSKYITEEQMKTYMPSSNKKIEAQCPNCKRYKKISPNTLHKNGLGCICGDGISYPNKFIYSIFKQLNIEVILEYNPKWSNRKQYDIYIPNLNCIIENHGAQHYNNGSGMFGTTYATEKQNDDYKENLAKINGIKDYIVIDCRYSNKDWIKQSVLNSMLLEIVNFSECDIDWDKCDRFATSSLVQVASELWNDGMCIEQIMDEMCLSKNTILKYLYKGVEFSFCDYDGKSSRQRTKRYKEYKNLLNQKNTKGVS